VTGPRDDDATRRAARERRLSRLGPGPLDLAEEGRRLASQRDDLIAEGADPAALDVPVHPADWPPEDDQPGDALRVEVARRGAEAFRRAAAESDVPVLDLFADDPEAEAARYAAAVEQWSKDKP
jgi:hypothetical protein